MIETLGTIAGILAVAGVILNNHKLIGCFYIWLISNGITAGIHIYAGLWSLAARDFIFILLAVHGIYKWRKIS
jgi:nicotinamide riboside transporter PnuC